MEEALLSFFDQAPYLVSMLAGLLTFLSPCVLPLIPAYLSYISGVSVTQLKNGELKEGDRFHIISASLLFIAGFSVVFILLGAAMARLIGDIFAYEAVNYIAGGIIIIFGLHVMHVITIPFLNYEQRADFTGLEKKCCGFFGDFIKKFAPFLLGVSFALGWSPCVGPILASIVSIAAQEQAKAILLMSSYAFGLAIPFFLSALLTSKAIGFLNKIKNSLGLIEKISGGLLIFIGLAIAFGGLGKISALLS